MITLTLPYEVPPLNANQRMHWAPKARWVRVIRRDAALLAIAAKLPKLVSHATITLEYQPRDRRRRDSENLAPTLKACVDGLVSDYGLTVDDDHTHVTAHCIIGPVSKPGRVLLHVEVER